MNRESEPEPIHDPLSERTQGGANVPLRLVVADDQPLIRRALALTLGSEPGIEVVGQASDGQEAIEQAAALQPDVIVMDLQMPRVSGVVATREISQRQPGVRIVVLTTFDYDDLVFEAIRAGAHAYLLKDATEQDVLETVRAVHNGESRLSPSIARKVLEQLRTFQASGEGSAPDGQTALPRDSLEESLTDKEQRVLHLLAQGLTNKQIGSKVFLAEGTVKNYVSRIMDKLHVHSRAELAVRAVTQRR